MSITKAKKNQIIDYMLEKTSNKSDVVGKTAENFMLSRTTIYRYLLELQDKNIIKKVSRGRYKLIESTYEFVYINDGTLEEDYIYN